MVRLLLLLMLLLRLFSQKLANLLRLLLNTSICDIRGEAPTIIWGGGGEGLVFLSSTRGQPLSVLLQLECRISGKESRPPEEEVAAEAETGLLHCGGVKL